MKPISEDRLSEYAGLIYSAIWWDRITTYLMPFEKDYIYKGRGRTAYLKIKAVLEELVKEVELEVIDEVPQGKQ